MATQLRDATPGDVPAVMQALMKMLATSPAKQMRRATPIAAELGVRDAIHRGRAYFVGGYFVMFDVTKTWYSDDLFLVEDLILKVYDDPNVKVRDAVRSLSAVAKLYGCVAVGAGDTQIGYMTPRYIQEGFSVLGTQLYKEL